MHNDSTQIKPTDERDADDEVDDELAKESTDVAPESSTATLSPSEPQKATIMASSATAKTEDDADERTEIEKQPYDFDHCTVQIAIQLLPADGDPKGRMIVVGVRSHQDAPILQVVRLNELGLLPPIVCTLLAQLKNELPARELAARAAIEKKKEEKAKRRAELEASRAMASQRGKKAAKGTSLSTAPTSGAAAADNRPRPEVNVPKTTQQQMGLLWEDYMITIQIDGQNFPLPEEIAAKDEVLKAALAPFVPWIANAQIDRKEENGTMTVNVIKRADWKGSARTVVSALIAARDEMNPAVALWVRLQSQSDLNDPGVVLALEPTIEQAITAGEKDIAVVNQSLTKLVECASAAASRIPLGF